MTELKQHLSRPMDPTVRIWALPPTLRLLPCSGGSASRRNPQKTNGSALLRSAATPKLMVSRWWYQEAPKRTCIALVALAVSMVAGCSRKEQSAKGPPAVPVTVATTIQKDVPVQVLAIGAVHAYSTVQAKSQVDGQLAQVGFKQGDEVKKDQLIFTIDPRPFDAALAQAQGFLDRDTASLKSAEADWQRTKELENTKAMSATAVDQARAKADSLRATVAADMAAVDNAKLQLAYCYIRSPIDGRIGLLLVNEGNIVKNSDSVLATINQLRPIYVDFSVPEQELPRIRRHMSQGSLGVEASIPDDSGKPSVGKLAVLNNAVDQTTGTIVLRGEFPNEDERLWPGQFVNVTMTLTVETNIVVVPTEAIQVGQSGQYVFVVRADETVTNRPVVVGRSVGGDTVIETGLQAGETVVTDGQLRLVPGSKVFVKTGTTQGGK
jgi:multidrug efflux system membrane fusion protein